MIIDQSIYNVPALTYSLETEIFSIVEYHLKCCSVADDAMPDCHMIWSAAACHRQGHQWVACTAAPVWELMNNTLNICSEMQTSLFDRFCCFMTLLRLCVWHAVKLLLALQRTVATHTVRFGGLTDVKVSLQNSFGVCLLKITNANRPMLLLPILANLLHTVKGPLIKTM